MLLFGSAVSRHDPSHDPDMVGAVQLSIEASPDVNTIVLDAAALTSTHRNTHDLAPLFVLTRSPQGWHPYTQMSYTGIDALFVALGGPPLVGDPNHESTWRRWTRELSVRHGQHGAQINNHQRWFINLLPGVEVEHKFTISCPSDIWTLAVNTLRSVASGELADWIPEHGNNGGFEQWEFLNHTYEITAPSSERGYIAFIPAVNGSWIIRRKWFESDTEIRREELTDGIDLGATPDLPAVIADRYGLIPSWSGCYNRVRYNVLLESLQSGNVFSIMYDRCTDTADTVPPLFQVEVEYIRSRTLLPASDSARNQMMQEFTKVTEHARQILCDHGVAAVEDHQSKLTWLRSSEVHT
jgi:hypothetical protein